MNPINRNYKLLGCLLMFAALILPTGNVYALTGSWRGELDLGQMKLPLVLNFSETAPGVTQCTMDSPAQGAKGIPTEVLLCTSDSISIVCNAIGASYTGKVSAGIIRGQFQQRGYSFPLNLAPETPVEDRRPQTPKPPFPYTVTDTVFTAPDGAVMSATLTIPAGKDSRKIPAVVMVTGSGAQNRDEELFEHKPFAVIADRLARNGIASLRYDDRGTAASGGNFLTSTTYTFRDDAAAAIDFLHSIPCVGKVGVLGHSEGGTIAFMLGADKKVDFIVSLAGMAISGKETILRQNSRSLDKGNLSDAEKADSMTLIELMIDTIARQARSGNVKDIDVDALVAAKGLRVPPQVTGSLKPINNTRSKWFDTFVTLNPGESLKKVKCPILAVNGEKDTQVYPDNLTVIKELAPQARTMLMPGLNHLMQHATTGDVAEYAEIRETISPEVLDAIVEFINNTCK